MPLIKEYSRRAPGTSSSAHSNVQKASHTRLPSVTIMSSQGCLCDATATCEWNGPAQITMPSRDSLSCHVEIGQGLSCVLLYKRGAKNRSSILGYSIVRAVCKAPHVGLFSFRTFIVKNIVPRRSNRG